MGLAGPVLGSVGRARAARRSTPLGGSELFLALAYVGFLLNLFNLLPVLPLDGGRAMAALSPSLWFVGYALLVAATILFPNPVLHPRAAARRPRDLAPLEGAQHA